jgi:superfamily I DNA and/or RNA helicase
VKASEIGIITPYDAQKKKIKNEIINQARVT